MTTTAENQGSRAFAATVLVSSFLIFQIQPLISRYILPWFGGTPGVWTACMLFFQVLLFAGYAYAHLIIRYLSPRRQLLLHAGLIALALCCLPVHPSSAWKPVGNEDPTGRILALLALSVGLPYFILSSTGPLVQAWFSLARPQASPYRLYSLSNIGSIAGLVTYPFLVEPLLSAGTQAWLWSLGFCLYAVCSLVCGARLWNVQPASVTAEQVETTPASAPDWGTCCLWFGLPACASVMLLATTNQVCLDVAVVPFLWVLPLTLYLLSFILCFDHEHWYPRRTYAFALPLAMACLVLLLFKGQNAPILMQIGVHFGALFFVCMMCHGELVRLKPHPRYLTSFYLLTSAGGAAGGIFVGLIAPFVFHRYVELHLGMLACCATVMIVFFRDRTWDLYAGRPRWIWGTMLAGFCVLAWSLRTQASQRIPGEEEASRNFYGVLRIVNTTEDDRAERTRMMLHGRILHGQQFLAADRRRQPTSYYGEHSGAGLALTHTASPSNRHVGIVGLGAGTLAVYGRAGDEFRMYEINPDVARLAREHFTYLRDSAAHVEVVLGDARLSLEREAPQNFDVLVLDAFSSDAIPVHLLTEEAFEIYRRHLRSDGVLAIHISNNHFDLQPIVAAAAEHFGWSCATIQSATLPEKRQTRADWMLVAPDAARLNDPAIAPAITSRPHADGHRMWTDGFSNLVEILK